VRRSTGRAHRHLNAGRRGDFRAGLFKNIAPAGDDGDVDAFPGERKGAGLAETSARAAQKRFSAADAEVH